MSVYSVRPASRDDHLTLYPEGFGRSVRGVVVERDGKPVGMAGLIPYSNHWLAFSRMTEKLPGKTVFRVAYQLRDMAQNVGGTVLAQPDPDLPNAGRFLERIGFLPINEGTYKWDSM